MSRKDSSLSSCRSSRESLVPNQGIVGGVRQSNGGRLCRFVTYTKVFVHQNTPEDTLSFVRHMLKFGTPERRS
jgi:hypothetical protein